MSNQTTNIQPPRERITIMTLKKMKAEGGKAAMLSIYDYAFAQIAQEVGLDIIIVGDSLGMNVLGYKNTLPVTMDQMISHTASVKRGAPNVFVVGDMPFTSYQLSDQEAIRNAGRFIKETGCEAVKCEASRKLISRIKAICDAEIMVMGHIGLNPQKIHDMGGYRIQGKTVESTIELLETALALQQAGVFSLLLEGVTEEVAGLIKEKLEIPVYGIGSGRLTDGQLLIGHDPLALYTGFPKLPIYIRRYYPKSNGDKNIRELISWVFSEFIKQVKTEKYPNETEVHKLKPEDWRSIKVALNKKGYFKKTKR